MIHSFRDILQDQNTYIFLIKYHLTIKMVDEKLKKIINAFMSMFISFIFILSLMFFKILSKMLFSSYLYYSLNSKFKLFSPYIFYIIFLFHLYYTIFYGLLHVEIRFKIRSSLTSCELTICMSFVFKLMNC